MRASSALNQYFSFSKRQVVVHDNAKFLISTRARLIYNSPEWFNVNVQRRTFPSNRNVGPNAEHHFSFGMQRQQLPTTYCEDTDNGSE